MDLKDYVCIIDDLVSPNVVSRIIKFSNSLDFNEASIGGGKNTKVDQSIRNTYSYSLTNKHTSLTHCHRFNLLHYLFSTAIKQYFETIKLQDYNFDQVTIQNIDILKYKEGGFYKYHVDHFGLIPRTFSCIMLLNNDYEGGEICFRYPDTTGEWLIDKKPGRIIVWPSNFLYPHRVKPVTKGTRYSVVSWAL
tara:strand:- start:1455 stop:2030 length:576 start_codon:yes stop_codon:yes gene_type:complete